MHNEKAYRSVIKAITWRITASIVTVLIVLFLSGDLKLALSIGALETFIKMAVYYFHERAWNLTEWGTKELKNEERTDEHSNSRSR